MSHIYITLVSTLIYYKNKQIKKKQTGKSPSWFPAALLWMVLIDVAQ